MNTLVKNSELQDFMNSLKYAYEQGIDAVILQDPGFISVIKTNFPKLGIHMSTQAGIMNSSHACLFSEVESINLARELDKKSIASIRNKYKKNLEIFVHGALCACISGSCLFSSLLGGRSGNRGKCAQPCRKLYNGVFLLSAKELCLIDCLPEIINLGIQSIKIEGRMRTPFYTFTTTSVYRKAIDSFYKNQFKVTPQMKQELADAFSREFTEGKFSGKYLFNLKQASGTSNIKERVYQVKTRPIKLEKRTGSSTLPAVKAKESSSKTLIIRVYNEKDALISDRYADIICLDIFHKDFEKIKKQLKNPLYAVTPRIMFDSDLENLKSSIGKSNPAGLLAGNPGILNMGFKLPVIMDYNSNCFNDIQLEYYESLGAKPIISPELSAAELAEFKNKDFIALIHGKIRLMTLAHDLPENTIRDEKGFDFEVKKIHNGVEILNGKELGLFNKIRVLLNAGINQFFIDTESKKIKDEKGREIDLSLETLLKIYRDLINRKTIDTGKIQRHYNLGWVKTGVI